MIYTPMTKRAMQLAFRLHRDQTDKGGLPYVLHPLHLAEQMTTEESTAAALLHDVAEDTDCTIGDLREMGFPQAVTDALALLTHDKSVPYLEYVERIKANPVARAVKLADLRHNSDLSRLDAADEKALRRAEKYRAAIELLTTEDAEGAAPPAEPGKDGVFPDERTLRSRIAASLYGGALGDALGYEIEFDDWGSVQSRFGPNGIEAPVLREGKARFSDDTQMTLFTAEGYGFGYFMAVKCGLGGSAAAHIHQAYLCWLQTQGFEARSAWDPFSRLLRMPGMNCRRAPGNTCLSALHSGGMGTIEAPINGSKGCGGVMRAAPLGFVRRARDGRAPFGPPLQNGAEAAAITHGHPLGWIPAAMLADLVDRCIYENRAPLRALTEVSLAATVERFSDRPETAQFRELIERAVALGDGAAGEDRDAAADEAAIRSLGEGWVGDEALAIALYAALRYPNDLKRALQAAVNHGGDSDSTGAIAGNVLGAYLGMDAVPEDWRAGLELTDAVEEIVDLMMRMIEG